MYKALRYFFAAIAVMSALSVSGQINDHRKKKRIQPALDWWYKHGGGGAPTDVISVSNILYRWTVDTTYTMPITAPTGYGVTWNITDSAGTVVKYGEGKTISASFSNSFLHQYFDINVTYAKGPPEKIYVKKYNKAIGVFKKKFARTEAHYIIQLNGAAFNCIEQDQGDGLFALPVPSPTSGNQQFSDNPRNGFRIWIEDISVGHTGGLDRLTLAGLYTSDLSDPSTYIYIQPEPRGVKITGAQASRGTAFYGSGKIQGAIYDGLAWEQTRPYSFEAYNSAAVPGADAVEFLISSTNASLVTGQPNTQITLHGFDIVGQSATSSAGIHTESVATATYNFDTYKMWGWRIAHNRIRNPGSEGIYMWDSHDDSTEDLTFVGAANTWVWGNIIEYAGWDGIQLALTQDGKIFDNYIYRSGFLENAVHQYAIILNPSFDGDVFNNIIIDPYGPFFHHVGRHGRYLNVYSNTIVNRNPADYMWISNATQNLVTTTIPINIYNNTFVGAGKIWMAADNSVTTENIILKYNNNIHLSDFTSTTVKLVDSEFSDVSATYQWRSAFRRLQDSTSMNFVDLLHGDLHLTSTSPKNHAFYPSDTSMLYDGDGIKNQLYWQGAFSPANLTYRTALKTTGAWSNPSDFSVANGTLKAALALPDTVTVTLSDATTRTINVTWNDDDSYNGSVAAMYTFTAIPYNVNDIDMTGDTYPNIDVTVNPMPPFAPTDISGCAIYMPWGLDDTPPIANLGTAGGNAVAVATIGSVTFSTATVGGHTMPHYNTVRANVQGFQHGSISVDLTGAFEIWQKVNITSNTNGMMFFGMTNTWDLTKQASNLIQLNSNSTTLTIQSADGVRIIRTVVPATGTTATAYVYDATGTQVATNTFTIAGTRPGTVTALGYAINDNSLGSPCDCNLYWNLLYTKNLSNGERDQILNWALTN